MTSTLTRWFVGRVNHQWKIIVTIGVLLCTSIVSFCHAADPMPSAAPTAAPAGPAMAIDARQARESIQWMLDLAVSKIPEVYEGDKNWDNKKKVWAGVHIERDGLKIKTHRKWREVRHGRWIRYTLKFPKPSAAEPPKASVREVRNLTETSTGTAPSAHWSLKTLLETPVEFDARVERWNLGVKVFSVNLIGRMKVRMNMESTLAFWSDFSEIPPALVIDPKVTDAQLEVFDVRVDRVSKVGGDVAEQWGRWMEDLAREVFLKDKNEKFTSKLNRAIDKNRDDLRFSVAKLFEFEAEKEDE